MFSSVIVTKSAFSFKKRIAKILSGSQWRLHEKFVVLIFLLVFYCNLDYRISSNRCSQGTYLISKLSGAVLIGGRCLKEGGAHSKVRKIIRMKFQNIVIISFQITVHKFHYDISRIYSKTTSYFHCAIICILAPCAFQFSYANKCVVFLITMESQILSTISHIKNISKKRPTNKCILSYQNKKGATRWDERTVKEVSCSLRAKTLLNSNNIAELEANGIPNLPTADVVHINPVDLDKGVQPSNLNSQQASQEIF